MREFIVDCWNGVMNYERNPLSNIPDLQTRHLVMQVLAWMWCIAFSSWFGSMWIFGFTAVIHLILIGAIALTVATFETAKRNPDYFDRWYSKQGLGRGNGGEHE
tara:strand:+ start:4585 stop:4896 length:312 start_codon:yes stop_codon:yes gene_type:complete